MALLPDDLGMGSSSTSPQFEITNPGYRLLVNPNYVDTTEPDYLIRDAKVPALAAKNSRYVIDNPFGNDVWVNCTAEVFYNGNWINSGIQNFAGNGLFAVANCRLGEGIILVTGLQNVLSPPCVLTGGTSLVTDTGTAAVSNLPVRIHVERTGLEATNNRFANGLPIGSSKIVGGVKVDGITTSTDKNGFLIVDEAKSIKNPLTVIPNQIHCKISTPTLNINIKDLWMVPDFNVVDSDTHNGYQLGTNTYIVPEAGDYNVSVLIDCQLEKIGVFLNDALYALGGNVSLINLNKDDKIQIKVISTIVQVVNTPSELRISKVSSSLTLGNSYLTEPVICCWKNNTSYDFLQFAPSSNKIQTKAILDQKITDTHSLYSNLQNKAVIKNSGYYQVSTIFTYITTTASTCGVCIAVNGISVTVSNGTSGGANYRMNCQCETIIHLNPGDVIEVYFYNDQSAARTITVLEVQLNIVEIINPKEYKIISDCPGGLAGQILMKNSNTEGDASFQNLPIANELQPGAVVLATPYEVAHRKPGIANKKVVSVDSLSSVTTIGNEGSSGYKCIYSAEHTGSLNNHDIVDLNLPKLINKDSRYILQNPFGVDTPVICEVEIFHNNKWGTTGIYNNQFTSTNCGLDEGIIVQTGSQGIANLSNLSGGSLGNTVEIIDNCPCRVHVWKVGNSEIPLIVGELPVTKIAQYVYSAEYEHVMRWDDTLGFYRSTEIVDIHPTMYLMSQLQKGRYLCDGSLTELTSKQGIILDSLSHEVKTNWKIIKTATMISFPNLRHVDGRWYYPRFGDAPGTVFDDAIRNLTGTIDAATNAGFVHTGATPTGIFAKTGSKTSFATNGQTGGQLLSIDASLQVSTAVENRVLSTTFLPIITIGI